MSINGKPLINLIILANVTPAEKEMAETIYKFHDLKIQEWKNNNKIPEIKKNSILLTEEFSEKTLRRAAERNPGVIGRLNKNEQNLLRTAGIAFFWDLEKYPVTGLPVFKIHQDSAPAILLSGTDSAYLHILQQILSSLSCKTVIADGFRDTLEILTTNKFDICIIDWDSEDMNLIQFIDKLGKIQPRPFFIGTKDFQKENLFQSLSGGIKNFSKELFSKEEILELIISSIPLQTTPRFSPKPEKVKILQFVTDGKVITDLKISEIVKHQENAEVTSIRNSYQWLTSPEGSHPR